MSDNKNIKEVDNIVHKAVDDVDDDNNYISSWWRCLMHVGHILGYCMTIVLPLTVYIRVFLAII